MYRLLFACVLLTSVTAAAEQPDGKSLEPRPNILVLIADDLGWGDMSLSPRHAAHAAWTDWRRKAWSCSGSTSTRCAARPARRFSPARCRVVSGSPIRSARASRDCPPACPRCRARSSPPATRRFSSANGTSAPRVRRSKVGSTISTVSWAPRWITSNIPGGAGLWTGNATASPSRNRVTPRFSSPTRRFGCWKNAT